MKAILLKKTCSAEELKTSEIEIPTIKEDHIIVKVNAFGINRSEVILRDYEADEDYIKLPIVPGIECVGTIVESDDDKYKKGDIVVSLMGGMGRSFNGSYEEYTLLPTKNVFKINDTVKEKLSLEEIAAVPETYFTAYSSLFECLQLKKEDVLLIRGATSATGLTALSLAKVLGCEIVCTTRNNKHVQQLLVMGADYVLIDDKHISEKIHEIYPEGVNKVLELIGPLTYNDSMKCLSSGGICCITGILGNIECFSSFNPIKDVPNGKYLTSFFSNYPTQEIIDDIFTYILKYNIKPRISKTFTSLDEVGQAHKLMESSKALGKIIVKLEEFD